MSKQHNNSKQYDTTNLTVWAEHRKEPDWDRFIAVCISMALAKAEDERKGQDRD
jgi:hypothetical protein